MYTYSKAVALQKSLGAQWQSVDLTTTPVADIYNDYNRIVLELNNTYLTDPVCVDMAVFKEKYGVFAGTIPDMLAELDNAVLDTVNGLPSTAVKYCKYSDAFRAGYKMRLCDAGRFYPDNYPKKELHDIAIARPGYATDMSLLHDHCLVTVNGYLHMTDADNQYTYVYKGGDSLRKSNQNQVGLLSFLDIGKLTKIPVQRP